MPVAQQAGSDTDARLAELEQERRELAMELTLVQAQVSEQRRQLRLVLDREERERRRLALQLHEATAQSLAGVLLRLDLLESDGLGLPDRSGIVALRREITATLTDLRRLAASLRPAVLDDLGLEPALERLAANARDKHGGSVTIVGAGRARRLAPAIETLIYRVVEEALDLLVAPVRVQLGADTGADELCITVTGRPPVGDRDPACFAAIRARLELAGGHLAVDTDADLVGVFACVPVAH